MSYVNRRASIKLIFVSLIIIIVLMLTASLAWAQEGARVYARPVDAPDNTLVVDVIAENVTDLYGAEFRLTYDPAVVSVQDFKPEQEGIQIETGTLLPSDKGFVVANQVDEAAGTVVFAMTLLNPAPPATGSGPLARVTFNILQDTPSTLNVEHAKLVAVDLQTIPNQTEAFAFGGGSQPVVNPPDAPSNEASVAPASAPVPVSVSAPAPPTEPTPTQLVQQEGFPWWIVAAVIMVLGILALGGFIVMDGLKSASTARSTPQNNKADKQTMYRASTFKNQ